MQSNIPIPTSASPTALAQMVTAVKQALNRAIASDEATGRVLMRSPAGKIFTLSVDDNGVLSTTPFTP